MYLGMTTLTNDDSLISAVRHMMSDSHAREFDSQYRSHINIGVADDLLSANTAEWSLIHGFGSLSSQRLLSTDIGTISPCGLEVLPAFFAVAIVSSFIEEFFIVGDSR